MKTRTWMTVLPALCLACLPAVAQESAKQETQPPLSLRLTDEVISKAVRETLAESRGSPKLQPGRTLSGDPYLKFERGFEEARKPSCLHPDATKFQPSVGTSGGWNYGVGGLFALPFWAAAVVRGKCN